MPLPVYVGAYNLQMLLPGASHEGNLVTVRISSSCVACLPFTVLSLPSPSPLPPSLPPSFPPSPPLQSLQNLGLTHVLHTYLRGLGSSEPERLARLAECQYEAAWRTSLWEGQGGRR